MTATQTTTPSPATSGETANLGTLVVSLLKGVLYQDVDGKRWSDLLTLQNRVRDYVSVMGLALVLDEAEGYAFLKTREENTEPDDAPTPQDLPRLVARRPLSFPVSLLLALLRKKMAEFDATGGDTRLILSRDDMVELLRLFLPDSHNEARLIDQVDRHLNKVVELGFLRKLVASTNGAGATNANAAYEVRRIIKAFIDAQWLADFEGRLQMYKQELENK